LANVQRRRNRLRTFPRESLAGVNGQRQITPMNVYQDSTPFVNSATNTNTSRGQRPSYNFSYLFIIDKKLSWREAMRASGAVVKNDYLGYTLFLIALAILNIAGVMCLFVGVLVTVPITMAAITVAYRDVVGFD
jgi:hypothetical protein